MPLYTLINLIILAGPLALSFDRKVAFFRQWPAFIGALIPVSGAYLVWDGLVTNAGHWWFSERYSGMFRIAGLPVGEILFFITVPYACIFIYAVVRAYFKERRFERATVVRLVGMSFAVCFVILALIVSDHGYTALAFASIAILLVVSCTFDPSMWMSSHTLLFFLLSYLPFLLANGALTALPIVNYSSNAILGVRVYTIPLEDFFYNFGMLGFYLFFFRLAERMLGRTPRSTRHRVIGKYDES